jgi:hypothetical protein
MHDEDGVGSIRLARRVGLAWLATLLLGMLAAVLLGRGIDINLSLVLSSAAMAGYFWLFLRSGQIPKLIAGWGVFASLFVAFTIVLRDFVPALGAGEITAAFMLSNLIALLSAGTYLAVRGVREPTRPLDAPA